MSYKAIIAGASGLVGSALLQTLLDEPAYSEVLVLVRKELPVIHKKLVQLIVDFDHLEHHKAAITGHALFCCLGSTRKKTPDLSDYRKVDFDYPVQLAQIAVANGISQYHIISSLGANAASRNFYTKLKGQVEEALSHVGLHCLHIYQPSFLVGARKERRPMEKIFGLVMKLIDPLLIGKLKKYRSIAATTVAQAMYKQSLLNKEGVYVHPSDHIKQLA